MKVMYKFADGTVSEVEVSEEIGEVIKKSRRLEENLARNNRRHWLSLDSLDYEGEEYGTYDTYNFLEDNEMSEKIHKAFNSLTDVQKRRLLMLAKGYSQREISRIEEKEIKTIRESIESARKKFLKNF